MKGKNEKSILWVWQEKETGFSCIEDNVTSLLGFLLMVFVAVSLIAKHD